MSYLELERTVFQLSNMSNVNLTGANLNGAVFQNVTLRNADLTGANLNGARFQNVTLHGAIFDCDISIDSEYYVICN